MVLIVKVLIAHCRALAYRLSRAIESGDCFHYGGTCTKDSFLINWSETIVMMFLRFENLKLTDKWG